MGSYFGQNIRVSLFGQSHGAAVGVVMDGLPAGFPVDEDKLRAFLARRRPGGALSSLRREEDEPVILSGIKNGRTTGDPVAMIINNRDAKKDDYLSFRSLPRPGHADFTCRARFGIWGDTEGGGHYSGRLTAPLTMAGAIALQMLEQKGVFIRAHALSIADVNDTPFDPLCPLSREVHPEPVPVLSLERGLQMAEKIKAARNKGDSVGGVIELAAVGVKKGLGNPMFMGLENHLAQAVFAVPAVRGVSFGAGFDAAKMTGSAHNDEFVIEDGEIKTRTNRHGGILGGVSTGMPILLQAAVKPTPSIALKQRTVNLDTGESADLFIPGRHDPCIVPRAVPAVEAAAALALLDAYFDKEAVWRI